MTHTIDPGTPRPGNVPFTYTPTPWTDDALCRQTGIDDVTWFPGKGGSVKDAKRICLSCPVRRDCLTYALEHFERYGVWGGLTERERRALLKRRAGAA